ncbi:hypothetical protein BJ546DRAFT_200562 [Cryomyces antarcticus]
MKLSAACVISAIACTANTAAAAVGHVFTYDPDSSPPNLPQPRAITPEAARLVFAQRLGLSQFHSLKGVEEATIKAVNDFGDRGHHLFDANDDIHERPRAMIVMEGDQTNPPSYLTDAAFTISSSPAAAANERLIKDLSRQASQLRRPGGDMMEELKALNGGFEHEFHGLLFRYYKNFVQDDDLEQTLKSLKDRDYSVTVVFMPPSTSGKRSAYPYGRYEVPETGSSPQKRQVHEKPLSPNAAPQTSSYAHISPLASSNVSTAPLKGILPFCFPSLSSCQTSTRNCTGHGSCILKYKNTESHSDSSSTSCYACMCSVPDVRTNDDGTKKTTHFGGPACQKKDVVMPFWLIAGFSVFLVGMVSWGIGLLYSIGQEDLPSVIGAGVSGPRAK